MKAMRDGESQKYWSRGWVFGKNVPRWLSERESEREFSSIVLGIGEKGTFGSFAESNGDRIANG